MSKRSAASPLEYKCANRTLGELEDVLTARAPQQASGGTVLQVQAVAVDTLRMWENLTLQRERSIPLYVFS